MSGLPTEPTWGIPYRAKPSRNMLAKWKFDGEFFIDCTNTMGTHWAPQRGDHADQKFMRLTAKQAALMEDAADPERSNR